MRGGELGLQQVLDRQSVLWLVSMIGECLIAVYKLYGVLWVWLWSWLWNLKLETWKLEDGGCAMGFCSFWKAGYAG